MASGSCLCGKVSIEYTKEPALKVHQPSNAICLSSLSLSKLTQKPHRPSATAPTVKKSAAALSASTTSSLRKASLSLAPPNPTPKLQIRERKSLLISVVNVDLLFTEMERISRV
jgi:hypothetical protein